MTEEFAVEFLHETDEAVLIEYENEEMWIPKSQMSHWEEDIHERHDSVDIFITDWIAEKKGLS